MNEPDTRSRTPLEEWLSFAAEHSIDWNLYCRWTDSPSRRYELRWFDEDGKHVVTGGSPVHVARLALEQQTVLV